MSYSSKEMLEDVSQEKFKQILGSLFVDEEKARKEEYIKLEAMYKREQRNGK